MYTVQDNLFQFYAVLLHFTLIRQIIVRYSVPMKQIQIIVVL